MAIVKTNSQNYSSIANAIREKGVSGTFYPSEMATAISNIPSGSSGIPKSGVVFIDYDGTVVETWEASDVASKIFPPALPSGHTRLVADGWNWTVADIKSYMQSHPKAIITVGQMYHTVSGKTELDITVTKATGKEVTCNISGTKDWGDGTTNTSSSHTYTNYGDYTIKCSGTTISDNVFGANGSNSNSFWCTAAYLASGVTGIGVQSFYYCKSLASVTLPNSVTSIVRYAFSYCHSLTSISIPNSVTSIASDVFYYCYSLTSISIPNSVTSIGSNQFGYCYSLTSISIPSSVTSIGADTFYYCHSLTSISLPSSVASIDNRALCFCASLTSITIPDRITSIKSQTFSNCYSLTSIAIPSSVTSIADRVFSSCYSIIKYDFSAAMAVPMLTNTNAFSSINCICKIVVPDALYNSWIADTNWSIYENYIYKASEVTD